jgi:probable phosphomutase (TIGR03848 family)
MTRLLLIRHAPTPETGKKLTGRLPGVSLGEEGVEIARRTATNLAGTRIAAVYASPIERTWETAIEVATPQKLTPIAHEGLLEVDYGDWSGRTLASLYKLKAWRVVQITPSRMVFPNGEGLLEAQERAVRATEAIAAAHRKKTVALVTHADVIKSVVSHYLGQPLDLFQRVGVAPASVSVIDLPAEGPPQVVAVNTNGDPTTWR